MKRLLLALVFIILLFSAGTIPKIPKQSVNNAAIEIVITDFLKCRASKNHNAFAVWVYEKGQYDRYEIPDELITISIASIGTVDTDSITWFDGVSRTKIMPRQYYITLIDTLGSTRLPTRHTVRDGKLFCWHDSEYGLTQEMIDILLEYNVAELVNISDLSLLLGYGGSYGDGGYGADYYLCKNDPSKYKRVRSRIATGWYKPPRLKCK